MLFGLANALATFQLYIKKCLVKKLDVFCIVYLDDILIYTNKKRARYEKTAKLILNQLRKFNLYATLNKCQFNIYKIYFIKYIVSFSKVHIKLKCIKNIKNWLESQFIMENQVFIGFVNFY